MSFYVRIAWIASTILMIAVNTLAITLPINNVSTKQLSDSLSTLITPIGWTFSIWSVIYLGLIIVAIRILYKQINVSRQITRAYIVSCICNAAWIVAWHYGYLTSAMLIIVWLLISLIIIDQHIQKYEVEHFTSWFRSIFLIYFWRVQIATLLMTTIYLIYGLGWITIETLWRPVLVIILTWVSNIFVIYKSRRIETSIVWLRALTGIYFWQTQPAIQTTCLIVGGTLLITIAFHLSRHSLSTSHPTWLWSSHDLPNHQSR